MSSDITYVVYDGECPFCSHYAKTLRLRAAVGQVEFVNARGQHPVLEMLQTKGVDLDEGMALVQGDQIIHGHECIHKLALMTTPSNLLNLINAKLFHSRAAARALYPVLRCGRNAALKLMGRGKLRRPAGSKS
jgi:predicted DCC family thiol-disulfide oxidoreductase YuxK